ncbi:MAG: signal peptide peptidase SppA [Pseudomonadota bacterium]
MAKRFWLFSLFGGVWRGLDGLRRFVHLMLMLAVLAIGVVALVDTPPGVMSPGALVLAPVGNLVDQLDGDAATRAWQEFLGSRVDQTLTRDLIESIDYGARDPRINALVLQLGAMGGAGMATLRDVADAIERFKRSGKPVVAIGDNYTQGQYYLASFADDILMHPEGVVFLQGFGAYRTYYKAAQEKFLVDVNVFKVGEYKSFVEPYLRDDMSPEARENALEWLSGLWEIYQADVTGARAMDSTLIDRYTQELPRLLEEADGDFASLALSMSLVDKLTTRSQMDAHLIEITGVDPRDKGWRGTYHQNYLAARRNESPQRDRPARVGVVVAKGDIVDGTQPPGMIGGDSTAALLRRARLDEAVKAVVLRVDSGGGSAFASEIIAEQVRELRAAGKPVVVSMGNTAASGGYWISMDADEIYASPVTITGSIGIGAVFPTFERGLDWLGVHVDGVGTTPWAGALRPDRSLNEESRQVLQRSIENGYADFIGRVANARQLPLADVDAAARGRVWLGAAALDLELVDGMGSLQEAIGAAARRAEIADDFSVTYVGQEIGIREALIMQFTRAGTRLSTRLGLRVREVLELPPMRRDASGFAVQLDRVTEQLRSDWERMQQWNDPRGIYLYCHCNPSL